MRISPHLLLVFTMLFWGGNMVLGRAVSETFPPVTLAYLRWLLGLIVFLPFCWSEVKTQITVLIRFWKRFTALGLTGVIGFNIFTYMALGHTSATNASLINAFSPITITLLSCIFLKEKISLKQVAGIVISFLGVMFVVSGGSWQTISALSFNIGDILMLTAVLVFAVYCVLLKKTENIVSQKLLILFSTIGGLVFSLPLVVIENTFVGLAWTGRLNGFHLLCLLYFAVLASVVGNLFFNRGLKELGPARTVIYQNLVFVFATILAVIFLDEKVVVSHLVGAVLIISGVYLNIMKKPEYNAKRWQRIKSTG